MAAPTHTADYALPALRTRLVALQNMGAHDLDPVRWHFIDRLLSQAIKQPASVACHLARKIDAALTEYENAVALARTTAQETVERITVRFPAYSSTAQALCSDGQFRDLARLDSSLAHSSHQQWLAGLNRQLDQQPCNVDHNPASASFTDSLRQQDREIAAMPEPKHASAPLQATAASPTDVRELKSARRFREVREQHQANRVINRAIAQCPDQSGPLNPQLLIVRSLHRMLDLSPHYVNRLVSHVNTILWLEQSSQHGATAKPAKKAPRKHSK